MGLLGAVPRLDQEEGTLVAIPGAPPNMARLPKGCPFSERCTLADPTCHEVLPALLPVEHRVDALRACHRDVDTVQAQRSPEAVHA